MKTFDTKNLSSVLQNLEGDPFHCPYCPNDHVHFETVVNDCGLNNAKMLWVWLWCDNCHKRFAIKFQEHRGRIWSTVELFTVPPEIENEEIKRKNIKPSVRYKILEKNNHKCQSCGAGVEDGAKLEIDHIKPVSKGGTNDPSNLQVLCKNCNIGKSDKY